MSEHDPESGFDPGWKPVFRKDHAPPNIRASKGTQSEEVSLERTSQWVSVAVGGSIGALRPISCLDGYASDQIALGFLEKKSQMVRRDFSRAVPETFAMVGWSTGRQKWSRLTSRSRTVDP